MRLLQFAAAAARRIGSWVAAWPEAVSYQRYLDHNKWLVSTLTSLPVLPSAEQIEALAPAPPHRRP